MNKEVKAAVYSRCQQRELAPYHGRSAAAQGAGQPATGRGRRANLPTCGEDHRGVPGGGRPLQERGYPAENAAAAAVRFKSRGHIN